MVVVVVVRDEKPFVVVVVVAVVGEGRVAGEGWVRCLATVERRRWCLAMPRAMRLKIWAASGATGSLGLGLSWVTMLGVLDRHQRSVEGVVFVLSLFLVLFFFCAGEMVFVRLWRL